MTFTPSVILGQITGYVGKNFLQGIGYLLNLCAFALRLLRAMVRRPAPGANHIHRAAIEQVYFSGAQALPLVILVAMITGFMLMGQFARLSGQYDLGKLTVFLIIRELGPIITALLVILRTATAVTVEIGHMNLFHEIAAMEASGADPLHRLGVPRMIGITAAVLLLVIVFDIVSILGGYLFSELITDIPVTNFLKNVGNAVSASDVAVGIVKAVFFGLTISIVCLYQGFRIRTQADSLSYAVSRSAIDASLFCLVVNVLISIVFYLE
jgi:phospholipid/cholesterol/gamma-HCH transport system permease protein